ncbi:MAG: hypothetical protein ICV71_08740 [Thermoleophilia bacterium]|nr:hypothetical protein [Thermoleophilia bacterium]
MESHGGVQVLYELNGALALVAVFPGHVSVSVAHGERERVDEIVASLRRHFRPPDPSSAHEVRVTFWTYGPHGPHPTWRSIAVPGWDEIDENYSQPTRERLDPLMRGFEPARGGQLVLWHGRAGTGKTYALRALAWEWREWCELHYIVDPDRFFGEHADYLMKVLLQPDELDLEMDDDFGEMEFVHELPGASAIGVVGTGFGPGRAGRARPWKLLMLEDTGELLSADARAVIGQGLSRFLNVVDGLIGQGLRVLVLVTTNEEIRALHAAVARPGRCAANVEFVPLGADEASAWFERRGVAERATTPTTLATLYALAEGLDPSRPREPVGFGG